MLNSRCIRQLPSASYIRAVSYLLRSLLLLFWALCIHAQLNPFYHLFYPDVMHSRENRYQPLFRTASDGKLGGPWERATQLPYCSVSTVYSSDKYLNTCFSVNNCKSCFRLEKTKLRLVEFAETKSKWSWHVAIATAISCILCQGCMDIF